jgi:hypothetical protein
MKNGCRHLVQSPFKLDFIFRNPHVYHYIFNPEEKICGEQPVSLLILVASAIHHRDRREAIRYISKQPVSIHILVASAIHHRDRREATCTYLGSLSASTSS